MVVVSVWNEGSVSYILRNERYCGNVLTWKQFTADIFEHKKKKNRQDRDQYLYTDVHEAIITPEQFDAAQVLFDNKRHGYKGGVPLMQVIDMGVFRGYVPINHHWINEDPEEYYRASNSVSVYKQNQKYKKNQFSCFDLSGYQVVRGQFLTARSELPTITITKEKISFNCSCIRKFSNVDNIQLLLHPVERKIAIRPCSKTDIYNIPLHKNSEKSLSYKIISCSHFCSALFQIMNWFPDYSYKILGTVIEKGSEQIVIFNLSNALPNVLIKETDKENDKTIRKRIAVCPEEWGDTFGEEFYNFSVDNVLYYANSPIVGLDEKSKPVDGQIQFDLLSGTELMKVAENLKKKAVVNNE